MIGGPVARVPVVAAPERVICVAQADLRQRSHMPR
jgi:hypothetical protein